VVGTNLPYGAVQNFGGKVDSVVIDQDVRTRLWAWLKDQSKELKRGLGWLLNRKLKGRKLQQTVPARRFVGVTAETRATVKRAIDREIFEVGL